MAQKLTPAQKHLLRLIHKERDEQGWAHASRAVMLGAFDRPIGQMPSELCVYEYVGDGAGRVRLTPLGESLVVAMEWL